MNNPTRSFGWVSGDGTVRDARGKAFCPEPEVHLLLGTREVANAAA